MTVRFSFLYNLYSVFIFFITSLEKGEILKTAVLLCLYGMFSRIVSLSRELRSLSKASAKVQQIFKLQNFFGSFFRRNFAAFCHCAEFQIFDSRKNFQHFGNFCTYRQKTGANKEKIDKIDSDTANNIIASYQKDNIKSVQEAIEREEDFNKKTQPQFRAYRLAVVFFYYTF